MSELDEMLTTAQAGEKFQVAPETIRDWIRTGKLRAFKVGHDWRIPHGELVRVAQQMVGGG